MTKILIAYYTKTGNTEKIAKLIAEGAKTKPNTTVEVKKVEEINPAQAAEADAFAFGSPTYFSLMAGPMLTLLTEFYFIKDKLAGKPMVAFSTGAGSQTQANTAIENILKAFNPKLQTSLAIGNTISAADEQQAKKTGETLASAKKQ
ncbi:MAG: flavodoxin family protein [Candidatus Bathyarchaeia archaeon]|jgi:NAD(P)H dehydrogenase (quinone)